MNGFEPEDDDWIVCPDCGYRERPEVGPGSFHHCPAGRARRERESQEFEARYNANGRRVRIAFVIEAPDSYEGIQAAMNIMGIGIDWCDNQRQSGQDKLLDVRWIAQRFPL